MITNLSFTSLGISAFSATAAATGALVAWAIRVCTDRTWVANPRADRWHKGTPCLFGGVPIWIGFLGMAFVFLPISNSVVWKLIAASTLIFALGLADDIWRLRPRTKLIVQ